MAPAHSIPAPLPPSVEEAYRRKCIQLKQRSNEVEQANDAARLRLDRIKRQVEKLRVERAFLLEQLQKRTSANVEDSEGSPSPPPTPKEKPLRTKRGHRKPSMLADLDTKNAGSAAVSQTVASNVSPSSESFPQGPSESQDNTAAGSSRRSNGTRVQRPERPANAFEMWSEEERKTLLEKHEGEEDFNVEEELAREWKHLDEEDKEKWVSRYEEKMTEYQKEKDAYSKSKAESKAEAKAAAKEAEADAEESQAKTQDEDVEMANYDTEDQEDTQAAEKTDD